MYHERQRRQLCGVHAINNLLQRAETNKEELDGIAKELTLTEKRLLDSKAELSTMDGVSSRHGTPLLGNYSLEVVQKALERRDVSLSWLSSGSLQTTSRGAFDEESSVVGFVINTKSVDSNYLLSMVLPKNRRHWLAVPRLSSGESKGDNEATSPSHIFCCVDSKLNDTTAIHNSMDLNKFLCARLEQDDQVFVAKKCNNSKSKPSD